jgi:hypothetical protein
VVLAAGCGTLTVEHTYLRRLPPNVGRRKGVPRLGLRHNDARRPGPRHGPIYLPPEVRKAAK